MRPQSRRAVGCGARIERRGMERIDLGSRFCAKADMAAALRRNLRHLRAQIDPEFGIALAEADGARACDQQRKAERRQRAFVKARRALEVADADRDVVDHLSKIPQAVIPAWCASTDPESRDSGFARMRSHPE